VLLKANYLKDEVMNYYCVYKLTFPDKANPRGRLQEIADRVHGWFKSNQIKYGMGAQGGISCIYGMMYAESAVDIDSIRESFADWLKTQPMRCDVQLGQTKPVSDSMSLFEKDWALVYSI
jgi:hypothetical protein